MKKTILSIVVVFLLSSCEVFNPTMKFKVSGSGQISITYSDSGGTNQWSGSAQTFEREMLTDEFFYLSAQSNSGLGCKVEAYIGNELIKQAGASGYGVASISGTY